MGKLLSKLSIRSTYSENLAGSRSLITEIENAGILDDATILLTPTSYSDARVHSVKTYTGEELITNGDFSDGEISQMGRKALDFWNEFRDFLRSTIERFPATPTGLEESEAGR